MQIAALCIDYAGIDYEAKYSFSRRWRAMLSHFRLGIGKRVLDAWRCRTIFTEDLRALAPVKREQRLLRKCLLSLKISAVFGKKMQGIETLACYHFLLAQSNRCLRHFAFSTWRLSALSTTRLNRIRASTLVRKKILFCRRALLSFEVGCLISRCSTIAKLENAMNLPTSPSKARVTRVISS